MPGATPFISNPWPFPVHDWLRRQEIAFIPGHPDPVLQELFHHLSAVFVQAGHTVHPAPTPATRVLFTTARFGKPLNWRSAKLFTARREYGLENVPSIITAVHVTHAELAASLDRFTTILAKQPPDPADYDFPGLAPQAYHTLHEQGLRGGPLMSLARLLQSQAKSIRILLVVGDEHPDYAYIFDLVGAHPKVSAADPNFFYQDIMLRLVTALSTDEVTDHRIEDPPIPRDVWDELSTPAAMQHAAVELGRRHFFTEMVVIANLVHVPSISTSVASQYSEGCFATWDPAINALIATVTGSARPVEKDAISEDDLAVITGVRPDGFGAIVRHVEGKRNDPPSSESVEMMEMDVHLPLVTLPGGWQIFKPVPVIRSKLHGHRGIRSYDPARVEFVPLEPAYHHYPVSCATDAQARGIVHAFRHAQSLQNPEDPRQAAFTVLPGHGVVMVEKWVPGKRPFEFLYQLMDSGGLAVDNQIPQGEYGYTPDSSGRMVLSGERTNGVR